MASSKNQEAHGENFEAMYFGMALINHIRTSIGIESL